MWIKNNTNYIIKRLIVIIGPDLSTPNFKLNSALLGTESKFSLSLKKTQRKIIIQNKKEPIHLVEQWNYDSEMVLYESIK